MFNKRLTSNCIYLINIFLIAYKRNNIQLHTNKTFQMQIILIAYLNDKQKYIFNYNTQLPYINNEFLNYILLQL